MIERGEQHPPLRTNRSACSVRARRARTLTRDPDDDYLVALSQTSAADVLVSGDRDLLDLEIAGVEVLTPHAFVERLHVGETSSQE